MANRKNEARWFENYQRWQINVQKDSKRKTFYSTLHGIKGKVDAEKQADKWLAAGGVNDNIRFDKLCADFLAYKQLHQGKSSGDLRNHAAACKNYLLPKLKKKKLEKITGGDWQSCLDTAYTQSIQKGRPLAAKSLKNIRATMTALYTYARRQGINLAKPEALEIPKQAKPGKRRILTPADIKTVFVTADYTDGKGNSRHFWFIEYVRFIILSGLRPGEAAGLKWTDINGSLLTINRSINIFGEITDGKNDNAHRQQYLSAMARQALNRQQQRLKAAGIISPWIFPDKDGSPASNRQIYKAWCSYRNAHALTPCTLYELRHTMVSATKNNIPAHLLKLVLGHSDTMDTFGIYGHAFNDDLKIVADRTDEVFNNILNG